ncbi:hypothetical protein J4733_27535 [Klebsiella pneumoniae]|uniref:TraI helicase-associated ssDBD N-terminal domain-containing protein n=1 Tax=Klebsiella pneumoniae TaxID=573 RepID=A0A939SS57_KLEPN|nr:hypothetical protein [Klebsiella pneumoniae]
MRLAGETVTGKSALQDGTAFIPGGTLIVDQAEKLSLKETISCSMARCAITCRSCSPTAEAQRDRQRAGGAEGQRREYVSLAGWPSDHSRHHQ